MRMTHLMAVISLFSLLLWGCGGPSQALADTPSNPQEISIETSPADLPKNPIQLVSTPETTEMTSNPLSVDKFIQLAKRDLANRLAVDPDQITVIEAVEIIWPDAALGCPSPGKVYAQGRVPGYQVRLEVNGVEYDYHMDQNGQYILCPNFDENVPPNPTIPGQTQSVDPGVPIK